MDYSAIIHADSISEGGNRLTTMEVTFPRMVLAEFNTHRMFSRNSASSRAIPVKKQIQRVLDSPFIPTYWGRNQSGMQAEEELTGTAREQAIQEWLIARDYAVEQVQNLLDLEAHKQLANRLLEPFMWHTVIVTATEWSNFFALRANPMAQPEIRTIAEMMQALYDDSKPQLVKEGEWHLPLIQSNERDGVFEFSEDAQKISAARCARVSYLTHDGTRDLQADLDLYERLVSGGHMSPLEHVATPLTAKRWHEKRDMALADLDYMYTVEGRQVSQVTDFVFSGNFRGWTQLRKLVPDEHDFSQVEKS